MEKDCRVNVFKHLSIWFLVVFISLNLKAQHEDVKWAFQLKRLAKQNENTGRVYQAISFYEAYLQRKNNIGVKTTLVQLYYEVREYQKALELIQGMNEEVFISSPIMVYYKAKILMINGQYDEAKILLLEFKKLNKGQKEEKAYKKLIKAAVEGCDSATVIIAKPIPYQPYELQSKVNADHIEFNTSYQNRETFFYSSLRTDLNYQDIPDSVESPRRKIYQATIDHEKKQVKFGGEVSYLVDESVDFSAGRFSGDGNRYYFSKCQMNLRGKVICELYYIEKDGERWSKPIKLPELINDGKYSNSHPTIGIHPKSGNDLIYFVSDRPEGVGGKDIWYTEYNIKKKSFKPIKNVGKRINTPGDEVTPWVAPVSGKFYFSSDGHYGIGGLDIFVIEGYQKMWKDLKNLGYPINSSADDLSYTVKNSVVLLTSNRIQMENTSGALCCDDIYVFKVGEIPMNHLIVSMDSTYNKELYEIKILKKTPDGDELVAKVSSTNEIENLELEKDFDYDVLIQEKGYLTERYPINKESFEKDSLNLKHKRQPLPTEAIILKNINYEFDSDQLTDSSLVNINKYLLPLLENNPDIKIELGAHTDSKGNDGYNLKLSQRRAESVVKYLISKGIDKERLVPTGYGETQPIAPNEHPDGSDNPEGRAENRRTEFKIIQ